jgi:hypothetical protein
MAGTKHLDRSVQITGTLDDGSLSILSKLVANVAVRDQSIALEVSVIETARLLKVDPPSVERHYSVSIAVKLTRTGIAMKLVQYNGTAPVKGAAVDTLLKTIARGNQYWQRLQTEALNITELAKLEGITRFYLTRVLRLAFLDPWIIDQIIADRHPAILEARKLTLSGELPMPMGPAARVRRIQCHPLDAKPYHGNCQQRKCATLTANMAPATLSEYRTGR